MRLAIAVSAMVIAIDGVQAPKPDLSERALIAAASRYVAEYEKEFAFLIAEEEYRQTRFGANGQEVESRLMRGELFLTYLPIDGEWIAVRDVADVDGQAVPDRQDLKALLLKREELRGLATRLVERNARFNIGRVRRNFNEPTIVLLLLEPKRIPRVAFDRTAVTRDGADTLVTLSYEERDDGPTLVKTPEGASIRARGEVLLEAGTGVIRRTRFEIRQPGMEVMLETTYTRDERLKMWLPAVFTERYASGGRFGSKRSPDPRFRAVEEVVQCEARYGNYRRFDVTGRIK